MVTSRFARFYSTLSSGIVRRSISNMSKIVEGNACIQFPDGVFYNKVQQFNRDITVAVLQHFQLFHQREWVKRIEKRHLQTADSSATPASYEGLRILEALAATGIRAIRFALEVPNISEVIANDLDPKAVELIHANVILNSVSDHVSVTCGDAIALMHNHKEFSCRFNVIDIDPYGTASPYLDAAIQCLHDGGLLCVTSTDMAVLCGSTPGTSMGKYGGIAVKNGAIQETGIRMLLHAIQSAASRHSRVIEPLLSLSIDFYARVFVRIWTSAGSVKAIAAKHAICFTCTGCAAYHIQPLGRTVSNSRRFAPAHGPPVGPHCAECGSEFNVWGPFWCGPLHSRSFLRSLLTNLGMPPRAALQLGACESPVENDALRPASFLSQTLEDPTLNTYEYDADLFESLPEGLSVKPQLTQPVLKEKVSDRFGTFRRIVGMCTMAYEELPDVALYYKADHLSAVLGTEVPSLLDLQFQQKPEKFWGPKARPKMLKTIDTSEVRA
ncbi:tRNA (guanine26-N2/guanine27-N2)-dimethyltransferase [Paragonimus westermani]|uniref:tRNA (guanine(26)-N(2))-dimethyltransferase n=1 Tax=Paragonimus westermani TaxID=34504 RepID=A0A5J4NAQ1_9TREM|nr:tRNA (guanine26-N2/guanine27-N2)-dimethyltransferase [Paragonimus westermani]